MASSTGSARPECQMQAERGGGTVIGSAAHATRGSLIYEDPLSIEGPQKGCSVKLKIGKFGSELKPFCEVPTADSGLPGPATARDAY